MDESAEGNLRNQPKGGSPFANLLSLSRKWIASGALPAWIGLWPVHLAMLLLIGWLLVRRLGWRRTCTCSVQRTRVTSLSLLGSRPLGWNGLWQRWAMG